ncbi:DUF1176 domain-containing protein [Vibrio sp. SCSIO 43137]|uniref:DUF1176 domain-containing protein n=1 Tax=Vibrio sp. SCSIO 43137 TaxID=3021011 RepID=UPI002307E7E6|nr:DUF1176 domain-containing protein [Vibrio sp. SCSIO 43137]WCE32486.1 DUF1176 domain-containing protein [Vibrio sp. SCSIO 43137]
MILKQIFPRLIALAALLFTIFPTLAFDSLHYENKDWLLICDNTGTCRATGYATPYDPRRCELSIASRNKGNICTSERPLAVMFTREAGPQTKVTARLYWGWDEEEDQKGAFFGTGPHLQSDTVFLNKVALTIESDNGISGRHSVSMIAKDQQLTQRQVDKILSVVRQKAIYRFDLSYTDEEFLRSGVSYLSDQGATAVFRKMDEYQGRTGTSSAIVDKGTNSGLSVKPPQPAPVIVNRAAAGELVSLNNQQEYIRYRLVRDILYHSPDSGFDRIYDECNIEDRPQLHLADLGNGYHLVALDCLRLSAYDSVRMFWLLDKNNQPTPLDIKATGYYLHGKITTATGDFAEEDCRSEQSWIFDGRQFVHANSESTGLCRGVRSIKPMPSKVSRVVRPDQQVISNPPNLLSYININRDISDTLGFYDGGAFAVLKKDGSVVHSWGDGYQGERRGLKDVPVWSGLKDVTAIYATGNGDAFVALRSDGTVVSWGDKYRGADISKVASELTNVKQVVHAAYAFAAIRQDDSVVSWGDHDRGGDDSAIRSELSKVKQIVSSAYAFAALRKDGSIVTWGNLRGFSPFVTSANYTDVKASLFGFAALNRDGTVKAWGHHEKGEASPELDALLVNVDSIYRINRAFAALTKDGTAIIWGYGTASFTQISDVESIDGNEYTYFSIRKRDGSVIKFDDEMLP